MNVRVLSRTVPVLRRYERALDEQNPGAEELRGGIEDLRAAVPRVGEQRDLLAARHFGSTGAQGRDLLPRPADQLVGELLSDLGKEIADRGNPVSSRQELQLEVV